MRYFSEDEVELILNAQRGNCYVTILNRTQDRDLASLASRSPEPGHWREGGKKAEEIPDLRSAFTLSQRQKSELKEWQEKIKDLFGEYGNYEYTFSPNGIGTGLVVKSSITGTSIDLSHIEDW